MAGIKTRATRVSPLAWLRAIENEQRRKDGLELLRMLTDITGEKAVMWGASIVGFGKYHYRYESGHEGEMCMAGFSPRKSGLVLYVGATLADDAQRAKLGKHRTGVGCLYINKLDDIDRKALRRIIAAGYKDMRARARTGNAPFTRS